MGLLIDGYNLMHAAGIIGRGVGPGGLERSRQALLNFVVEAVDDRELMHTVVVFDAEGAPPGLPRTMQHKGITVRFAAGYEDADSLIEELIQADSAPRRLTLVSSDHRLQRAARRRRATAVDSDRWYRAAVERRQRRHGQRPPTSDKPPEPSTEFEVEFWMRELDVHEPRDESLRADDPFPPGWADDVRED